MFIVESIYEAILYVTKPIPQGQQVLLSNRQISLVADIIENAISIGKLDPCGEVFTRGDILIAIDQSLTYDFRLNGMLKEA